MTKNKLLILFVSLLSLIGCNRADGEKCEIRLTESVISIPESEGIVSVSYSLSPSFADAVVDASLDADWLKVAGVSTSAVSLAVSANSGASSRTAMLTLSRKGASDVVCHIVQNADYGSSGIFPESKLVYVESGESDVTLNFRINSPVARQDVPGAVVGEGADWLHVKEVGMSKVILHADVNMGAERDAELAISFPGLDDAKVVFVQNAFVAKSAIRIPSAVVTVDCTAQSLEAAYSVTGVSAGQSVDVELLEKVSWVRMAGVTSSRISFELDANESDKNRSVDVRLSLSDAHPVTMTIIQKADAPFDIKVKNVTSASATVSINPKSAAMTYAYSVEPKSLFDKMGSEAYIAAYLESLLETAEKNGVALKDLLASGTTTVNIDKLKDNTGYYALAFDLDGAGKSSGKVTLLGFSTPKAAPSDNRFSFRVSSSGVVSVKTTNDDPYIFDVWDIESWNDFETPQALAERFVEYMKGFDNAIETYTHRGDYSEDYKKYLTSGRNVAFAFGYKDGITTDVFFYMFDW